MRARVRKERGGFVLAADVQAQRRAGEPVSAADGAQSRPATEVIKNSGQGANLPPWPALVAATIPPGTRVLSPMADPLWKRTALELPENTLIVLDAEPSEFTADELAGLAKLHGATRGGMLVGYDDNAEAREALREMHLFKVAGAPDRLFGATYELTVAPWLEQVSPLAVVTSDTLEKAAERPVKLIKAEESDERIVYGIVLEPDGVDAQSDTISAEEIRGAAHKFLQEYGNVGLQHQTFINGKARILESFIAPADFDVGDQLVKKGTWVMSMRVLDDDIWDAVKSGLITGFSIGGTALRVPAAVA